jgi:CheY-like chemotaxis protein
MKVDGGSRGRKTSGLGISTYVTKPVRESVLRETILRALGSKPDGVTKSTPIAPTGLRKAGKSLCILVVDDNAVNRLLATRLIEKEGHTVVSVESGVAALEVFEKQTFDLVLMDIQMPDMDGFEATHAIREKERQSANHVPIIAMTAHAMECDRQRCLSSGMEDYVSKPISKQALLAAIENVLPLPKAEALSGC